MEEELILTGYCRCIDGHRMVTAEWEDGQWCADCSFGSCPYEAACEIGKRLADVK